MMTIFRRELGAYFNAAIAYIFIIVFVLLNGGLFMSQFFLIGIADMRPFFGLLPLTLAVFLPAVTMRLWAEEKRGNTLELLLTFPTGTHELVFGKFLAGFVFYLAALAATLPIPLMLSILGHPDGGLILGGYLGAALLGAFFLSVGIFISGLCRDQIVAFILAMMVCFGLHMAGTEFIASTMDSWLPGFGSFLQRFIGSAGHFESFAKGVVDGRDVLYFLLGTAIFLILNGFWFEGRMRPGAKKIFTIAALVSMAIFLSANWLFSEMSLGRFDLTEGKLYTISPATKKILGGLKTPVLAKFYISPADKMPTGMKTLEQDVIDKLDEFRIASKGNFQYKIFHMEAANVVEGAEEGKKESLEQQLQQKGIQPFQVRAIESDQMAVKLIYSSLSLAYKEKPEEMIARVLPENLSELEYLMTSKIYRMTLSFVPGIAIVAPYQEAAIDPQMAALLSQLGSSVPQSSREDEYELLPLLLEYDGYNTARIKLTEEDPIPRGTKTLAILEPASLTGRQKYEINRFLREGGSVFLAVQNYTYSYSARARRLQIFPEKKKPGVNDLLQQWGLKVDENVLADEQYEAINISGAESGPFDVSIPVRVPTQILVTEKGMNPNVSITSRLADIFYLWGTALEIDQEKIKSQGLKVQRLLSSSNNSWTLPFAAGPLVPSSFTQKPENPKGPFPLAVLVEGQFADAFEGKPAPDWNPEPQNEAVKEKKETLVDNRGPIESAPGKLLLIGAATIFQRTLAQAGGHVSFFMNSMDALTLSDDLVGIRSKQPINRSLSRISSPAKVFWRFFVMMLVPVALAAIGTARVILRRRAKQNYLKAR